MVSDKILEDMFLREKPARIIVGLKKAKGTVYATLLSKEADCTYSHTVKILSLFQKYNIVEFEKTGRIKKVKLTETGWDIAQNLDSLVKKFEQIESAPEKKKKK